MPSDALVFFGATGNLACEKILSSLQAMIQRGNLDVPVIGVAKAGWSPHQPRDRARSSIQEHGTMDKAVSAKLTALRDPTSTPRAPGVRSKPNDTTRGLLDSGTLQKHIDELSVVGLTSNPTIIDHAISRSDFCDTAIAKKVKEGKSGEALFFELAIEDSSRTADLFKPIHERTNGVDGWVSLEVSPKLACDTKTTLASAKQLHAPAGPANLLIRIAGTREGLPAIEEAILSCVPVNVKALASPNTVNTMPEATLLKFGEHGTLDRILSAGGGESFVKSWDAVMTVVASKAQALK